MRLAFAAAALVCASPAFATGGLDCRSVRGGGPALHLVIGHGVAPALVSVRMTDGLTYESASDRMGSRGLTIARSWIDDRLLWLDLADRNATRFEGRLRATFQPKLRGRPAVGTFVRNGHISKVRCTES